MEKIEQKYKKISCLLLNISESKYNKDIAKESPPLIYNFLRYFTPTYIQEEISRIKSSIKYLQKLQESAIFVEGNTEEPWSNDEKIIPLNDELNLTLKENESELDVYNRMKKIYAIEKNNLKNDTNEYADQKSEEDLAIESLQEDFSDGIFIVRHSDLSPEEQNDKFDELQGILNQLKILYINSTQSVETKQQDECISLISTHNKKIESLITKYHKHYDDIESERLTPKQEVRKKDKMTTLYKQLSEEVNSPEKAKHILGYEKCAILPLIKKEERLKQKILDESSYVMDQFHSENFLYMREKIKKDFTRLSKYHKIALDTYSLDEAFNQVWRLTFDQWSQELGTIPYCEEESHIYPREFYLLEIKGNLQIEHKYLLRYYQFVRNECFDILSKIHQIDLTS